MKTRTTFILALTIIITFAAGSAFGSYSGGTGEPNNPYQIATNADLLALAANTGDYGKCFILTTDIDMEGQVFTTAIIAPDTSPEFDDFQGTAFTGTFNGNGHKITNFTINGGSNSCLGLFGCVYYGGSGGSVKNLGLENFAVSGWDMVGGLVGENWGGRISNCYSAGTVSGGEVGGLVGRNFGSISNCYSTGSVSGLGVVGGLVGLNPNSGSISNCYSTGTVTGGDGSVFLGVLVGYNDGSISDCYSTGAVSGTSHVGGLAGGNPLGSISNCYSTGAVSGTSYVGGLVGDNGSSIFSSFWDTQTSGQTIGVGSGSSVGVAGKTTTEMKTLSTFTSAGWDFTSVWVLPMGQYPMLFLRQAGDLNYDGVVDFKDFAIFAENWLSGE